MKKKIIIGLICPYTFGSHRLRVSENLKSDINLSDLAMTNVEALAINEHLPGKECRYKGSSTYADYIPCTTNYPSIGKCGSREMAYYSADTGQCYE